MTEFIRISILYDTEESAMPKKLTLSIDDDLIEFAHEISKKSKKSISGIFSDYLKSLRKKHTNDVTLKTELKNMYGMFNKTPIPDKKILRKKFHDKDNN